MNDNMQKPKIKEFDRQTPDQSTNTKARVDSGEELSGSRLGDYMHGSHVQCDDELDNINTTIQITLKTVIERWGIMKELLPDIQTNQFGNFPGVLP